MHLIPTKKILYIFSIILIAIWIVLTLGANSIIPEPFYYQSSLGRTFLPLVTIEHRDRKYLFLVDTGSTISIVSPQLLSNLEAELRGEIFVEQTQSNWSYYEIMESISIAGFNEKGIIVFSDNVKVLDSINRSVSVNLDGILGMNYLSFFDIESKIGDHPLYFHQTLLMRIAHKFTESVSSPTPSLKFEINVVEFQAILDTGYTGFLQIPDAHLLTIGEGDILTNTRTSITVDSVSGDENQLMIIPKLTFNSGRVIEEIPTDISGDTKVLVGNLLLAKDKYQQTVVSKHG
jgi:predicted aspartyl protease